MLYKLQLGLYLNLLVSQFFDVKRKDFIVLFIHHLLTLALLFSSYYCNFMGLGALVLMCHDACDIFLELGKLTKYAGYQFLADIVFGIFIFAWIILRMTIFPYYVIYYGSMVFDFSSLFFSFIGFSFQFLGF